MKINHNIKESESYCVAVRMFELDRFWGHNLITPSIRSREVYMPDSNSLEVYRQFHMEERMRLNEMKRWTFKEELIRRFKFAQAHVSCMPLKFLYGPVTSKMDGTKFEDLDEVKRLRALQHQIYDAVKKGEDDIALSLGDKIRYGSIQVFNKRVTQYSPLGHIPGLDGKLRFDTYRPRSFEQTDHTSIVYRDSSYRIAIPSVRSRSMQHAHTYALDPIVAAIAPSSQYNFFNRGRNEAVKDIIDFVKEGPPMRFVTCKLKSSPDVRFGDLPLVSQTPSEHTSLTESPTLDVRGNSLWKTQGGVGRREMLFRLAQEANPMRTQNVTKQLRIVRNLESSDKVLRFFLIGDELLMCMAASEQITQSGIIRLIDDTLQLRYVVEPVENSTRNSEHQFELADLTFTLDENGMKVKPSDQSYRELDRFLEQCPASDRDYATKQFESFFDLM